MRRVQLHFVFDYRIFQSSVCGKVYKTKLTIDGRVYRLTDVDTRGLFSDKTDKTGPLLKVKKEMSHWELRFGRVMITVLIGDILTVVNECPLKGLRTTWSTSFKIRKREQAR